MRLPSKFVWSSSSLALIPFRRRAGNKYFKPCDSIKIFEEEVDSGRVKLIIFKAKEEEKLTSLFN